MVKTNYKSLAKRRLRELSKEYQALKDKHELENPDSDYEYEDDEFICSISDLEHLIEDDSYRTKFNIMGDFSDKASVRYQTHHIFKDLQEHDDDIQEYEDQIKRLRKKIEISKILKTQTLSDTLHLDDKEIAKQKNTYSFSYKQKSRWNKYWKVVNEQRDIFLKYRRYV